MKLGWKHCSLDLIAFCTLAHGTSLPRGNASSSILLANHLLCFTHPTPFHPDLFFPKVFPLLKKLNLESLVIDRLQIFWEAASERRQGCPVPALVILRARQDGYSFFFSICLGISEYWPNIVRLLWGHKGMWMEALDTCLVEALLHCDPEQTTETILFLSFSSCGMSISFPSLPFSERSWGLPCIRWGLTVPFHKLQDFSLNSLTIVYKVIVHSILSQITQLIQGGFLHSNVFASDCIKTIVKILACDELIKIFCQLDPNHRESPENKSLLIWVLYPQHAWHPGQLSHSYSLWLVP